MELVLEDPSDELPFDELSELVDEELSVVVFVVPASADVVEEELLPRLSVL